jgi:hypothetical protein
VAKGSLWSDSAAVEAACGAAGWRRESSLDRAFQGAPQPLDSALSRGPVEARLKLEEGQ